MQVDHVFVLVEDLETASNALMRVGMEESLRRRHPGQGTENICFLASRMPYLELLAVSDRDEVRASAIAAANLGSAQWRANGAPPSE